MSEEAIRCTVATLQLLEPLHWVWRDGERSEEEVAAALRIQEEARRRAARRLEAWRLEAAREWEHARQRGLWFRHWEGVEGRRMARMDAEARRVEDEMKKGAAAAQRQRAKPSKRRRTSRPRNGKMLLILFLYLVILLLFSSVLFAPCSRPVEIRTTSG